MLTLRKELEKMSLEKEIGKSKRLLMSLEILVKKIDRGLATEGWENIKQGNYSRGIAKIRDANIEEKPGDFEDLKYLVGDKIRGMNWDEATNFASEFESEIDPMINEIINRAPSSDSSLIGTGGLKPKHIAPLFIKLLMKTCNRSRTSDFYQGLNNCFSSWADTVLDSNEEITIDLDKTRSVVTSLKYWPDGLFSDMHRGRFILKGKWDNLFKYPPSIGKYMYEGASLDIYSDFEMLMAGDYLYGGSLTVHGKPINSGSGNIFGLYAGPYMNSGSIRFTNEIGLNYLYSIGTHQWGGSIGFDKKVYTKSSNAKKDPQTYNRMSMRDKFKYCCPFNTAQWPGFNHGKGYPYENMMKSYQWPVIGVMQHNTMKGGKDAPIIDLRGGIISPYGKYYSIVGYDKTDGTIKINSAINGAVCYKMRGGELHSGGDIDSVYLDIWDGKITVPAGTKAERYFFEGSGFRNHGKIVNSKGRRLYPLPGKKIVTMFKSIK